ncbi:SET domain-containing protein-lysine N-methyltransferase [Pandoraea horticolens]|nr:SET domain-containing protein-lysine N-methyltransferase [Pandoraea horticolens]
MQLFRRRHDITGKYRKSNLTHHSFAMTEKKFLYPIEWLDEERPTSNARFEVALNSEGQGYGVRTLAPFSRGELVSRMTGLISNRRRLHTLQVTETIHLYDPYFSGLFLHSCSPSVGLDMQRLEVWALRDIEAGEFLTMDYASTEDFLFRQFECQCGAPNCRKWITGFKELPNNEGKAYLAKIRPSKIAAEPATKER